MVEHRQEFERELEAIEAKVIELFAMVAEDLPGATHALLSGNNEVIKTLAEREQAIDSLYPEIEEMANREILLQAPVASDLRFLLSVLRIVPELERSHDLVMSIAGRANHILSEDLSPRCRGLIEQMGNLASSMWRQAVDSWYQRDQTVAVKLDERDNEMDELYASLIAELAAGRMTVPVTMEMTLVARFYERLGDHAVNISRRVVYLAGSRPLPDAEDGQIPRRSVARVPGPVPVDPDRSLSVSVQGWHRAPWSSRSPRARMTPNAATRRSRSPPPRSPAESAPRSG